jgi:hypothetical protein
MSVGVSVDVTVNVSVYVRVGVGVGMWVGETLVIVAEETRGSLVDVGEGITRREFTYG